jgi:prepilin peptidase CpaA
MLAATLFTLVGAAALTGAAWDLATLKIPNWISLVLLALFPALALAAGLGWADAAVHVAVGVVALMLGVALFAGGIIGGGDAKLFAALALYMGLQTIGPYLLAVGIAGGVLAVVLALLRSTPVRALLDRLSWAHEIVRPGAGVPYGIAIAAGGLIVLPATHLFALAAAGNG